MPSILEEQDMILLIKERHNLFHVRTSMYLYILKNYVYFYLQI